MTGLVRLAPALVSLAPQIAEGPAPTRTASLPEPGTGPTAGVREAEPFSSVLPDRNSLTLKSKVIVAAGLRDPLG